MKRRTINYTFSVDDHFNLSVVNTDTCFVGSDKYSEVQTTMLATTTATAEVSEAAPSSATSDKVNSHGGK